MVSGRASSRCCGNASTTGVAQSQEGSSQRRSPSWVAAQSSSWVGPGRWAAQGTLQVRPCKLGRRIHAAHAPAQPIYPATDRFRARPPTEKKEKTKSKSGLAGRFIALCRAEPCSAHEQAQRRDPLLIFFFFSVGGRPPKSVRGRSGWVRGGVSRMDAAAKPYLMGIWQRRCREPAWAAV